MKAAVVVFPGTNCDRETFTALVASGFETEYVWHDRKSVDEYDLVVLPGGFSYGDYLRPGAISRFSPVMKAVERYADSERGIVLGICNGFQILLESGLLPGAMTRNESGRFICKPTTLEINDTGVFAGVGKKLSLYIAHSDGRYTADEDTIAELEKNNRILMRYEENPNGSARSVAAVANASFSVIGMMPHPERSSMKHHGSLDGLEIFGALGRWHDARNS